MTFFVPLKTNLMEFLSTFIVIGGAFGIAFLLINIRHIFTGQEFRGSCASNNPMIKNEMGECNVCGRVPGEDCQMPEAEG
jgi:hypothetical protein